MQFDSSIGPSSDIANANCILAIIIYIPCKSKLRRKLPSSKIRDAGTKIFDDVPRPTCRSVNTVSDKHLRHGGSGYETNRSLPRPHLMRFTDCMSVHCLNNFGLQISYTVATSNLHTVAARTLRQFAYPTLGKYAPFIVMLGYVFVFLAIPTTTANEFTW